MDKKNIFKLIAIVLVVVSILVVAFAFVSKNDGNKNDNNVDSGDVNDEGGDVVSPPEELKLTYDAVYHMALSLYGGDDVNIVLEEETERFVIKRIFKATGAVERYFVDKENGFISTEEVIFDAIVTG